MKDNLFTITGLSRLTGKSRRSIELKLARVKPVEKKGRSTYYTSQEALEAIYRKKKDELGTNLNKEQTMLTAEKRKKAQLEREKLEGNLIETKLVLTANQKLFSVIKAKISGLPVKTAAELSSMENTAEIAEYLRKKIHLVLIELSDDRFSEIVAEDVGDFLQKSQDVSATT